MTDSPRGQRSRPTLSVIMPNYNHARYLRQAIASIAEQSRPPEEFLILDDASTDESVEVIEEAARRYPFVRVLKNERNQGVIRAHQRLFEAATGEYVLAAAADDIRLPGFFAQAMSMAERYRSAGLIFGQVVVLNERDEELAVLAPRRWQEATYADPQRYRRELLEVELASFAVCAATVYRRDAFQEVGWYRPDLGSWSDAFATQAIGLKYGVCYVPAKFAAYRRITGAYSHSSRTDPRHMLNMIARAARTMRSAEFRDRFPECYVRRWERQYRRLTIWNEWLGDHDGSTSRPGFVLRNLRRLPRTWQAARLWFYRGEASEETTLREAAAR